MRQTEIATALHALAWSPYRTGTIRNDGLLRTQYQFILGISLQQSLALSHPRAALREA
jgi:hypothetical protein